MKRLLPLLLLLSFLASPFPRVASFTAYAQTESQLTTVSDRVLDAGGQPRSGKVTFILTQAATSPGGLVIKGSSVSAQLDASGRFTLKLYPSASLSPQSYYQVWFEAAGNLNRELLGVYEIPASTTVATLAGRRVTDTALAARYTFASTTDVDRLTTAVATATFQSVIGSLASGAIPRRDPTTGNLVASAISDDGASVSIARPTTVGGTLTATNFSGNFSGNGAGITGLTGATGGVSNTGSTTIAADTDANGVGVVDVQIGNQTKQRVTADSTELLTPLRLGHFAKAALPATAPEGSTARVSDDVRGEWIKGAGGWYQRDGRINVKDFGARGDGVTDDTAAIQAAIDVAAAKKIATIFAPAGLYIINGALQGTFRPSRLRMPTLTASVDEWLSIEIVGESQPSMIFGTISTFPVTTKGTIFQTTLPGGALIGGSSDDPLVLEGFTLVYLTLRNITFRTVDNPSTIGVDGLKLAQLSMENVQVDTGVYSTLQAEPTNANGIGVTTPAVNNSALNTLRNVSVTGYRVGIEVNEHTLLDYVNLTTNRTALRFPANIHASHIGRISVHRCPYVIEFTGIHAVKIEQLNIEHANPDSNTGAAWQLPIADIQDPGNLGRGEINWHVVKGNVGIVNDFTVVGGELLDITQLINRQDSRAITARVLRTTAQLIPTGVITPISFNQVRYDSTLMWDSTTPTRLYFRKNGSHLITAHVGFEANATGFRFLELRFVNELGVSELIAIQSTNAIAGEVTALSVTAIIGGAKNSYIEVLIYHNSGGGLNVVAAPNYSPQATITRLNF